MSFQFSLRRMMCFFILLKLTSSCAFISRQASSDYEYMFGVYNTLDSDGALYAGIDPQFWREKTEQRASLSLGTYRFFVHPILRTSEVDHLAFYLRQLDLGEDQIEKTLVTAENLKPCFYISYHIRDFDSELAHYESLELEVEDRWERFYQLYWVGNSSLSSAAEEVEISGSTGNEREYRHWGVACAYSNFALDDYFTMRIRPLENQFPFFGATAALTWDYRDVDFPVGHPSHREVGEGSRSKKIQSYKGW